MIHWLESTRRELIQKDPDQIINEHQKRLKELNSDELFELASAFDLIGEGQQAKSFCRMALQKNMGHAKSLYGLALSFFTEERFEEAQRAFQRAIRIDSHAADSALYVQKKLRTLLGLTESTRWGLWCLEQLNISNKCSESSQFALGKILFERSEFEQAVPVLKPLISREEFSFEVTQYLSYIFERLYSGDELIEKTLELVAMSPEKSDLFFNLAMVCQHDQDRLDLAIHFFYLASRADRKDPGLRFSLEQACLELMGKHEKPTTPQEHFDLMLANLYHGSIAVAERYARSLRKRFNWKHPNSFKELQPAELWQDWLLKDEGILGEALAQWFGDSPIENWKISPRQ